MHIILFALFFLIVFPYTGMAQIISRGEIDPSKPGDFVFVEEFLPGSNTSQAIGAYGWLGRTIGGAPTLGYTASTASSYGVFRLLTSIVTGQGGILVLDNGPVGFVLNLNTLPGAFDVWMRIAVFNIANSRARFGLIAANGSTVQPVDGVFLRHDTATGFEDTNFMLCRRAGSDTEACVDTTVAADTLFHTFHIYSISANPTTIYATIDTSSPVCLTTAGTGCGLVSTTIPTASLSTGGIIVTDTIAARALDFDFFGMRIRGLTR